jgi:hypothetical protein
MHKVESFKIESEAEADAYLEYLFNDPKHRTMDEATVRAERYIPDERIKNYFLSQAENRLTPRDRI